MKKSQSFWFSISLTYMVCAMLFFYTQYGTVLLNPDQLTSAGAFFGFHIMLIMMIISVCVFMLWFIESVVPKINKEIDGEDHED